MTLAAIIASLRKIERAQQDRIEVWRVVVDEKGNEIGRLYRGSFQRDPNSGAHSGGEPK